MSGPRFWTTHQPRHIQDVGPGMPPADGPQGRLLSPASTLDLPPCPAPGPPEVPPRPPGLPQASPSPSRRCRPAPGPGQPPEPSQKQTLTPPKPQLPSSAGPAAMRRAGQRAGGGGPTTVLPLGSASSPLALTHILVGAGRGSCWGAARRPGPSPEASWVWGQGWGRDGTGPPSTPPTATGSPRLCLPPPTPPPPDGTWPARPLTLRRRPETRAHPQGGAPQVPHRSPTDQDRQPLSWKDLASAQGSLSIAPTRAGPPPPQGPCGHHGPSARHGLSPGQPPGPRSRHCHSF